jgi:RNA polymerase sigma-70 factor, ECF subfamily
MNYSELSSEALVQICGRMVDDSAAWEEFVHRYQPFLAGIVIRMVRKGASGSAALDLADDLVQEIFLKICADRAKLLREFKSRHPEAILGYLKSIAISVVYDNLRKRYAQRRGGDAGRDLAIDSDETTPVATRSDTAEDMEQRILVSEVDRMLDDQSRRDREIFWLYYQHGLTARAISTMPGLDLTVKGVESVIDRVSRQVRVKLGSRNPEGKSGPSALYRKGAL